jgi:hypothetical protein
MRVAVYLTVAKEEIMDNINQCHDGNIVFPLFRNRRELA